MHRAHNLQKDLIVTSHRKKIIVTPQQTKPEKQEPENGNRFTNGIIIFSNDSINID